MCAPAFKRSSMILVLPFWLALYNAVNPSCSAVVISHTCIFMCTIILLQRDVRRNGSAPKTTETTCRDGIVQPQQGMKPIAGPTIPVPLAMCTSGTAKLKYGQQAAYSLCTVPRYSCRYEGLPHASHTYQTFDPAPVHLQKLVWPKPYWLCCLHWPCIRLYWEQHHTCSERKV